MNLTVEQRERIQDFVTALRSGDYAQTANQLGKVNNDLKRYCCEGVAVERYAADVGYKAWWDVDVLVLEDPDGNECHDYAEDDFWEVMALSTGPDNGTATAFAFVLPDSQDDRETGAGAVSYMALNDVGFTFAQIADLIEWQYLACLD